MAVTNTNVTVLAGTSTAPALATGQGSLDDKMPTTVYNPGPATVFVGGPSVTTSNGIPVLAAGTRDFSLMNGETIYAICSTVTTTVAVMKGRQ